MGHYSSGSQWVVTTIIMIRILAITSLAFLVSADADADAYYALHAPALVPALLNSYPNWPGVSTPFSSSTCYGCRGKRSAEPGYGFMHHFVPLPLVPAAAVSSDGANYAVHKGQAICRSWICSSFLPCPSSSSCCPSCIRIWNQSSSSLWVLLLAF